MTAHGLHLIHGPGGRVIPMPEAPSRTTGGIGEDAVFLGLIHMVRRIANPTNRLGLALATFEAEDICAGLAADATVHQRETALQRVAENHADWTTTQLGQAEVRSLRRALAPDCGDDLWGELVAAAERADSAPTPGQRAAAEQALFELLSLAVNPHPTVIRLPSRRPLHDGPGAA
jgi:hypothetical protein